MKIFLGKENISSVWLFFKNYIRKQFSVFGNILKMLFSYKFFTFSQFPNKFYITKSTTTHTSAPTENPPLSTQNPPPHNTNHQNATTHTTTTTTTITTTKKKKNQRSKRESIGNEIDLEEEINQRVADNKIDPEEEMI